MCVGRIIGTIQIEFDYRELSHPIIRAANMAFVGKYANLLNIDAEGARDTGTSRK